MLPNRIQVAALLCGALVSVSAMAAVTHESDTGFVIVHKADLDWSPADAYAHIVNIANWWNPAHTFSGDAANLSIAPYAGGCWCEQWDRGQGTHSVQHMTIVNAQPGKLLRATGGLGPLQGIPGDGVLDFVLAEGARTGTSALTVTYSFTGFASGGLSNWARPVDQVIGEQVGRLQENSQASSN